MTMELEGNILLERAPTRRWVSIIAVVIPAAAFAMLATWFIRVYVAPPTVAVSSPMVMASPAPQSPAPPQQIETKLPDPPPPTATVSVAQVSVTPPPVAEPAPPSANLPMLGTLSAAAPATGLPPAEPALEASSPKTTGIAQPAAAEQPAPEVSEPIAGPVPLPRSKPRLSLALVTGTVPLPRPKPVEEAPPPDLPATDIHAVQ